MYLISHVGSHLGVEVHQPTLCDRSLGILLGIQEGSRGSKEDLGDPGGIYYTKVLYKTRLLPIR
jgi:hypothetical protein